MTNTSDEAAQLIAELLVRKYLPRTHPRVKQALADAELFLAVEQRLAQVGLRWVDNVYADHVTLTLLPAPATRVLGEAGLDANNNLDLPRDAVSLLVVVWALIVLPKRERQASRVTPEAPQNDMFAGAKPLPTASSVSPVLSYKALLEDYGNQLGKKTRLDTNLKLLERHGFIVRKQDDIAEGPLLDVLLDYDVLAPRILNGALADVLAREQTQRDKTADATSTSPPPATTPAADTP